MSVSVASDFDFWMMMLPQDVSCGSHLSMVGDFSVGELGLPEDLRNFIVGLRGLLPEHLRKDINKVDFVAVETDSILSLINSKIPFLIQASQLIEHQNSTTSSAYLRIAVPLTILPGTITDQGFSTECFNSVCNVRILRKKLTAAATVSVESAQTIPKARSAELIWSDAQDGIRPSRRLLPFDASVIAGKNVFMGRTCPDFDFSLLSHARSVWVAGKKSWTTLNDAGVTVHGSTDSLGERQLDNQYIKSLFPGEWVKLTHQGSFDLASQSACMDHDFFSTTVPYYEVIAPPEETLEEKNLLMTSKTHFFWMSASSFLRMKNKFPIITSKYHSAGIGLTAELIASEVTPAHFQPFFNSTEWRNSIL